MIGRIVLILAGMTAASLVSWLLSLASHAPRLATSGGLIDCMAGPIFIAFFWIAGEIYLDVIIVDPQDGPYPRHIPRDHSVPRL